ncbi:MAG: BamA/TamA family outer membrane protein [Alphaproteobacteria bacterium]|nr:BamA/TamA family outer membrane protein [Alphaproteobacteria bacterium]
MAEAIADVLPDREAPDSLFDAERLAEEAAGLADAYLRSEGYYAATITPVADDDGASLRIEPGRRFVFAAPSVAFDGDPPEPAAATALREDLGLVAPGAPARAADVLGAEIAAVQTLRARGYPDAAARPREAIVDHESGEMRVAFSFKAGGVAELGRVRLTPDGVIDDALAQRLAPWTPGERYTPEKLTLLRRNAARTGAFASVAAALAPETDAQGRRDVILTLEPLERRTIELGAGYSTTDGAGVEIEWSRRNLWRRAETLTLGAVISSQTQSARAELALPNASALGRTTRYTLTAEREDAGPYDRNALSAAWAIEAEPRQAFGLSYGLSASAEFYDASAGVENAYIFGSFVDVIRDTTNTPLDARDGHVLELRVEPAVSTGDATLAFARVIGDARVYETPDAIDNVTFAARARAGYVAPFGGDEADLPLNRLFYAGGGGSVRGFAHNSIFPGDPLAAEPVGGQALFEVSTEARVRFGERWGMAAFVDGGSAFDDELDMRWGAGIGVRYDLGFAPLRVDIAAPLDRRDGEDAFALYLSLGQAF